MNRPVPTDGHFSLNSDLQRYEYRIGDHVAFARFRQDGCHLYIDYVEAPPELRGTGAAGKLMQHLVDLAYDGNLELVPVCGYAAMWLERHHKQPDRS